MYSLNTDLGFVNKRELAGVAGKGIGNWSFWFVDLKKGDVSFFDIKIGDGKGGYCKSEAVAGFNNFAS